MFILLSKFPLQVIQAVGHIKTFVYIPAVNVNPKTSSFLKPKQPKMSFRTKLPEMSLGSQFQTHYNIQLLTSMR